MKGEGWESMHGCKMKRAGFTLERQYVAPFLSCLSLNTNEKR